MNSNMIIRTLLFAALMVFGSLTAQADPIGPGTSGSLSTTIYGDGRDGNPGDLAIDVTIDWEVNDDGILTAKWTVSISEGTCDDYGCDGSDGIRIKAFGFNLDYAGNIDLGDFTSPYGSPERTTVEGTGNVMVDFLVCNPTSNNRNCSGGGSVLDMFMFTMQLDCGVGDDFACATLFSGADIFDGGFIYGDNGGQIAAHIIGFDGGCSGAVGGLYDVEQNEGSTGVGDGRSECGTTTSVPEPGTLWLLGAGLIGLGLSRRQRKFA